MLLFGSNLPGCPILSLHVGDEIARVTEPIIDPENLKVVAFKVLGPLTGIETGDILPSGDVRETGEAGMIVNSTDDFVSSGDVIRLDRVMKLNFSLIGLKVVTKKGTRLGKVSDYMVNSEDFVIQQIVVRRPLLKSFNDPELWIGRSEIVEINDEQIIVKDEEAKIKQKIANDFTPDFVNPFRKQPAVSAQMESPDEAGTE